GVAPALETDTRHSGSAHQGIGLAGRTTNEQPFVSTLEAQLNPGVELVIRHHSELCLPDMALRSPPLREILQNRHARLPFDNGPVLGRKVPVELTIKCAQRQCADSSFVLLDTENAAKPDLFITEP